MGNGWRCHNSQLDGEFTLCFLFLTDISTMAVPRILVFSGLALLLSLVVLRFDLSAQTTAAYQQLRDIIFNTQEHQYKTYLLSKDPLVIYIENFINLQEAAHLVGLA